MQSKRVRLQRCCRPCNLPGSGHRDGITSIAMKRTNDTIGGIAGEGRARLSTFPVSVRVEGRRVVIVGGDAEAVAKAHLVAMTSAEIVVFAPHGEADLESRLAG